MNDRSVTRSSDDPETICTPRAYILFYQRRELPASGHLSREDGTEESVAPIAADS